MPTYQRFEDLPVWQKAADLAASLLPWCQQPSLRGKGDLANQLQRATLSISNNIAEGFERSTTNELIHYLYIARGSAGEVRSMLCIMDRMVDFKQLRPEISDFKSVCESISRQIRGWTDSLQNSEIKGQRHLNNESRVRFQQQSKLTQLDNHFKAFNRQLEQRLKREAEQRQQASDE